MLPFLISKDYEMSHKNLNKLCKALKQKLSRKEADKKMDLLVFTSKSLILKELQCLRNTICDSTTKK